MYARAPHAIKNGEQKGRPLVAQRGRGARNFHSRLKFSFSVWKFHSRLKNSISGPVFLRPERGPEWKFHSRLKISFRIESLIFSILPLEIEFFQSWGPLGNIFWGKKKRPEVNFPSRGKVTNFPSFSHKKSFCSNPSFHGEKVAISRERESYFQGKIVPQREIFRGPKTHPKSRNTKKNGAFKRTFFEKFARTFAFFPVMRVRNPAEVVQKNAFRWTFLFWVDFFGWIFLLWIPLKENSSNFPSKENFASKDVMGFWSQHIARSELFDRKRLCNHALSIALQNPDLLLFLAVLDFLAFFFFKEILAFMSVFLLFFPRILGVRPREQILAVFVGFSLFFQNGKEKKIREVFIFVNFALPGLPFTPKFLQINSPPGFFL